MSSPPLFSLYADSDVFLFFFFFSLNLEPSLFIYFTLSLSPSVSLWFFFLIYYTAHAVLSFIYRNSHLLFLCLALTRVVSLVFFVSEDPKQTK